MKGLTQKYPLNWFSTVTFTITESKVIQSHKSLWGSWERPFPLKDISAVTGKIITGNKAWDNFGWTLFAIGVGIGLVTHLSPVSEICILLGVVCFLIRFMVRNTFIAFSSRESNNFLFSIRVSNKDDEANHFVEDLKNAITNFQALGDK